MQHESASAPLQRDFFHEDFRAFLARFPGTADLIVTSPPYVDARTPEAYGVDKPWTAQDDRDLGDAMRPGGTAFVVVGAPVRPRGLVTRPRPPASWRSYQRALAYCRRWGVDVVYAPRDEAGRSHRTVTHDGPDDFSIDWPNRAICLTRDRENFVGCKYLPSKRTACALVHDLSHILVGTSPAHVNEIKSAMLALDYYGARFLRLTGWSDWMQGFTLEAEDPPPFALASELQEEWQESSTARRGRLLRASLAKAVRKGLLTPAGQPTFRWTRPRPAT